MINPNTPHEYQNSNPQGFDSNCSICEGKHRDAIHDPKYRKPATTPYEALLLASAVEILKSDPRKDEYPMNGTADYLDTTKTACSNQGSQVLNPPTLGIIQKEPIMAKAGKLKSLVNSVPGTGEAVADETPAPGTVVKNEDGGTTTFNPAVTREPTKQELKEAAAKAKIAAKAEKQAAALAKKEAAAAAKAAKVTVSAEERAAKKAEREARLAELGKNYKGSMLALADKVKQGAYVKGATGQLRSNDELAQVLDGVTPNGVIQLGKAVLALEVNPYSHLNVGQQSMNLRNRIRGAVKKGTLTIAAITDYIKANDLDASESIKAKLEAKAKRIADRKAEAEAKAAAKAKAVTEKAAAKTKEVATAE